MLLASPIPVSYARRLKGSFIVLGAIWAIIIIFIVAPVLQDTEKYNLTTTALLVLGLTLVLIIYSLLSARYFIKSIKIDPENDLIKVVKYKFDKPYKVYQFPFKNSKVRVEDDFITRYRSYRLVFYSGKEKVISIKEGGPWHTDIFVKIAKYVSKCHGLPFYGNTILITGSFQEYFPDDKHFSISPSVDE